MTRWQAWSGQQGEEDYAPTLSSCTETTAAYARLLFWARHGIIAAGCVSMADHYALLSTSDKKDDPMSAAPIPHDAQVRPRRHGRWRLECLVLAGLLVLALMTTTHA